MRKALKSLLWFWMLMLLAASSCFAALPKPVGFVNDFAQLIDQRTRMELNDIAERLRDKQGIEIAVVTVATTQPETPKQYATKLFNEWGIGGPEDSGLLILLALEDREIQVEVGYGLEGVLPDGNVGAILDDAVIPYFVEGDYSKGLLEGTKAFAQALSGESYSRKASRNPDLIGFIIFIFIAALVTWSARRSPSGPGPRGPLGPGGTMRRTPYPPHPMPPVFRGPRGGGGGFGGFGGGRSGGGGAGRKF
ncbi:MAG: TPM domain-containing protein [Firmicutes bacterium]|nr:TPM domain-containing protein [Bacillota bacterium]